MEKWQVHLTAFMLVQKKKSLPRWRQFSSLNLDCPPFLTSPRLQGCSLAALRPDEVLRAHSPGHAGHAGPSDEAWHGTHTLYRSCLFHVKNQKRAFALSLYRTSSFSSPWNTVSDTLFSSQTDPGFSHVQTVHFWITSLKGKAKSRTCSLSAM